VRKELWYEKADCKRLVKLILGWEGLTARDTLTYYDTELITAVKSCIVQALPLKFESEKSLLLKENENR